MRKERYTLTMRSASQAIVKETEFSLERVAAKSPAYNSLPTEQNSIKMRPSRRLFVPNAVSVPMVCEDTGIVSSINVPAMGAEYLVYSSPFAVLENARVFAQRNETELIKTDSMLLAGILLTLAEDYSLFRFAPAFSGAQKNSLLRTCSKNTLVNSIHLIEKKINSGNYLYLPKLSFLMDGGITLAGEFERRLAEWNATVANVLILRHSIYRASASNQGTGDMLELILTEDEFYNAKPKRTMEPLTVRKEKRRTEQARIAQTKLFRSNKKEALVLIASLHKQSILSNARIGKLKELFQGEVFLHAKPEYLALIKTALTGIDNVEVQKLLAIVSTKYPVLQNLAAAEDELWGDDEHSASLSPINTDSVETKALEQTIEQTIDNEIETLEEQTDSDEASKETVVNVDGKAFLLVEHEWAAMSFVQKILYKKQLKASYSAENWLELADYAEGMTPADFAEDDYEQESTTVSLEELVEEELIEDTEQAEGQEQEPIDPLTDDAQTENDIANGEDEDAAI